jgi:hypothetical protein
LILSYVKRQEWLQRNQAVHVINVYAEAMSGGKGSKGSRAKPSGGQATKVSGNALLGMMGRRTE